MKKVVLDLLINTLASLLPIIILQFLLFPLLSRKVEVEEYGIIIFIIGLITIASQSFSVSIGNSRMLLDEKYKMNNQSGDFNLLLLWSLIISTFLMCSALFIFNQFNLINVLFVLVICLMQIVRKYLLVYFRIVIDYISVMKCNALLIVGYLFGYLLFLFTGYWQLILLLGEVFSLLYLIRNTSFLYEKWGKTGMFKSTLKHSFTLLIASLMGTVVLYLDRLLLLPLMGAEYVAIYFTASLLGKTLSLGITPINNVMLSYLIRKDSINLKSFIALLMLSTFLSIVCFVLIIYLSEDLLVFLYPDIAMQAIQYIEIITIATLINLIASAINPIVMRFSNIKWQSAINISNMLLLFLLSFVLIEYYGFFGFCVAMLVTSIMKLLLTIIAFFNPRR